MPESVTSTQIDLMSEQVKLTKELMTISEILRTRIKNGEDIIKDFIAETGQTDRLEQWLKKVEASEKQYKEILYGKNPDAGSGT